MERVEIGNAESRTKGGHARQWLGALAISLLLLVPCVWHKRLVAGDLGSHVYNAWLAQQIKRGDAPGLYLVRQWHNVLVDVALERTGGLLGWGVAEKAVAGAAVLIFFWGAFTFVSAAARRKPWELAPAVAMLAYGWTFQVGFINYYVSVGLAFLSAAMLWRGRGWKRAAGAGLVPLIWAAHPLGIILLIVLAAYSTLRERIAGWPGLILPAAGLLALGGAGWEVKRRFGYEADWAGTQFYLFNGADQLALYGRRYAVLAAVVFFVCVSVVAYQVVRRKLKREDWRLLVPPLEMYLVAVCAAGLLPQDIQVPLYPAPMGLLVSRMTLVSAVLGLCLIAGARPKRWVLAPLAVCTVAYFTLLYRDTGSLGRLQAQAESLVSTLPPGQRIVATFHAPEGSRLPFQDHVVDRACVQRCFSYQNYEPASRQFRVRVQEGSPVATASADDAEAMASGEYTVREEDPPLVLFYQCAPDHPERVCLRALAAGDVDGDGWPSSDDPP